MEIFFNFLKFIAILVAVLIVIFLVLLSLPNSKLRQSILKIYSIISFVVTIISAIYIISPLDIVPDVIPVVGQSDDLAVAVSAIATAVSGYVSWQKSKKKPE